MGNSLIKSSLNIYIAGYGCCKQEIIASAGPAYDVSRFGVSFVSFPETADVLVFQGFYNGKGLKKVINIYNQMVSPKWVIALGKCAIESLSHEGSEDSILYEFKKRLKVDVYVPGCPPRPEAFIYSLLKLIEKP
ncbi:MAG TPA: NADH-quinone oxidoreductase subunit NuoB [Candidatus Humimicrobiaceae bacterium]|nr:NADH-quinone oxidoreductase subunit NuoB [Actinomycetota bacterium]